MIHALIIVCELNYTRRLYMLVANNFSENYIFYVNYNVCENSWFSLCLFIFFQKKITI